MWFENNTWIPSDCRLWNRTDKRLLGHFPNLFTDIEPFSTAASIMANGNIIQTRESFRVQEGIQETQG